MSDAERTHSVHTIRGGKDDFRPPEGPVRRLAAILSADISGYSRLMQLDESVCARLTRQRRELIEPTLAEHHGRLIKYTGDGFLAMFDSPVEAVRCAIVVQQSMVGRNAALPREQWILYRIGVHLGDVIVEPSDVYGDGVNIAARIEGIARPGDVYVSGGVYEQVKNRLVCAYQSLGDRQVKNITEPVTVYRVLPDPDAVSRARRQSRPLAWVAALILGAVAILGGFYASLLQRQIASQAPTIARAPGPQPAGAHTPAPAPAVATAPAPSESPKEASPPTAATAPAATQKLPEMVSVPGGTFDMGSDEDPSEKPVHRVTVKSFAISKFPVTVREWKACVAASRCSYAPAGEDDAPVANLSWTDARQYVDWLSDVAQRPFRLPTEAEWEFAARGGKGGRYWWGDQLQADMANCKGCNEPYDLSRPLKVGSFKPNPFGLFDMGGNVHQWVEDCWHKNYLGAPAEGSAWSENDCRAHVLRSGSWRNDPSYVRPSSRDGYDTGVRYPTHGLRVAHSL